LLQNAQCKERSQPCNFEVRRVGTVSLNNRNNLSRL
jgi:hypothetical protein